MCVGSSDERTKWLDPSVLVLTAARWGRFIQQQKPQQTQSKQHSGEYNLWLFDTNDDTSNSPSGFFFNKKLDGVIYIFLQGFDGDFFIVYFLQGLAVKIKCWPVGENT